MTHREKLLAEIRKLMLRATCESCLHAVNSGVSGMKCQVSEKSRPVRPKDTCQCHEFDAMHALDERALDDVMRQHEKMR